jgi:hypothetical protein
MSAAFSDLLISSLAEQVSAKILLQIPSEKSQSQAWPEMMTLKTAGRYMDRSPEAVRRLIRLREIPAIKGDRKLQVRKAAIDAWAARNEV